MNNSVIVRIEMSGNRYNAFSSDGTKYTSDIGTGTRKRAFENGMAVHVGDCSDEWLGALSSEDLTELNSWVVKNNKEMI